MVNGVGPGAVHDVLKNYILADGLPIVFDAARSHGAYLVDARSGDEYLDFFAFYASLPVGYNLPGLWTEEWQKKIAIAALIKPTLSDIYTPEMATFVKTLATVTGRSPFRHYFFVEGGALAVENALKAAFDWKVRKNLSRGINDKGSKVLHFKDAFHGRSGYTLSLTNTFDPRKTMYFPKFDWPRIVNPAIRFPLEGENLKKVVADEQKALQEIQKAISKNPHDIAALIIEPIQSEGGDNHFRAEFLQALRQVCDDHEILLIFDEVQTGLGGTGKWWAFEHFNVLPDIVAFGKKTQVCGLMATARLDDVDSVFKVGSRINSTFGGNLADMVRATRYLEYMKEHRVVENAAAIGEYLLTRLQAIAEGKPRFTNVRGRGLLVAFDLESSDLRDRFLEEAYKTRLLVIKSGEKTVRLRPALTLTRENVDHFIELVQKVRERMVLPV